MNFLMHSHAYREDIGGTKVEHFYTAVYCTMNVCYTLKLIECTQEKFYDKIHNIFIVYSFSLEVSYRILKCTILGKRYK